MRWGWLVLLFAPACAGAEPPATAHDVERVDDEPPDVAGDGATVAHASFTTQARLRDIRREACGFRPTLLTPAMERAEQPALKVRVSVGGRPCRAHESTGVTLSVRALGNEDGQSVALDAATRESGVSDEDLQAFADASAKKLQARLSLESADSEAEAKELKPVPQYVPVSRGHAAGIVLAASLGGGATAAALGGALIFAGVASGSSCSDCWLGTLFGAALVAGGAGLAIIGSIVSVVLFAVPGKKRVSSNATPMWSPTGLYLAF